jgi:hypothetical protein
MGRRRTPVMKTAVGYSVAEMSPTVVSGRWVGTIQRVSYGVWYTHPHRYSENVSRVNRLEYGQQAPGVPTKRRAVREKE